MQKTGRTFYEPAFNDTTGGFTAGLLLLAGCALLGAIVVVMLRIDARREQLSGEVAGAVHA